MVLITGAILTGAIMTYMYVAKIGVIMTGAIMNGSIMTGAIMTGAILTGAISTGAISTGVNLTWIHTYHILHGSPSGFLQICRSGCSHFLSSLFRVHGLSIGAREIVGKSVKGGRIVVIQKIDDFGTKCFMYKYKKPIRVYIK